MACDYFLFHPAGGWETNKQLFKVGLNGRQKDKILWNVCSSSSTNSYLENSFKLYLTFDIPEA